MLLSLSLALATSASELASSSFAANLWDTIGLFGRIAVFLILTVISWAIFIGFIVLIGRRGRQILSWVILVLGLVTLVAATITTQMLPSVEGSVFNPIHQLIRIGGVIGGTLFVFGFSAVALPVLLTQLERRAFFTMVAARHLRSSKSGFLTLISVLSILGVALSSFAMCAVISIMGGFGADLRRKILGNNGQVRVESVQVTGFERWREVLDVVRATPGVEAATPVVNGEVMSSSSTNTAGVLLRGVDTSSIGHVVDLPKNVQVGSLDYLENTRKLAHLDPDTVVCLGPGGEKVLAGPDTRSLRKSLNGSQRAIDPEVERAVVDEDDYPGVVIGRELAKTLHVCVGDEVTLVSPMGNLGPMGVLPRTRRFRVAAIFYSGLYEYDAAHAYVKIDRAQELLDMGPKVTAIDARLDRLDDVKVVAQRIARELEREDVRVTDWKETNKQLFSALELEKIASFIILSIAVIVACFCIICTLLLMVTEKSKEIAVLKAIGASDGSILRVFMTEGILIGAIGTLFGVLTGVASAVGVERFGIRLDPDVYYVDRLPIAVEPFDYAMVAVCALLITTLATTYPAYSASKVRPVEGIRHE